MNWGVIGDWLGELQAGTWTELVVSVLTAGTLLLGFSILRRDRMKDTRAQAMRVLTWYAATEDDERWLEPDSRPSAIHIKNTSDIPVFELTFRLRPLHWWEGGIVRRFLYRGHLFPYKVHQLAVYEGASLEANEEWVLDFPFTELEALRYRSRLSFKDAVGVMHVRDVSLGGKQRFAGRFATIRDHLEDSFVLLTLIRGHGERSFSPALGYEVLSSRTESVRVRLRARELYEEKQRRLAAVKHDKGLSGGFENGPPP